MARDRHRSGRDGGYALIAAVVAVAAFAWLALQVLAEDQGALSLATARLRQARLSAAAEAGVSLAIHGLAAEDRAARWSIDGRPRQAVFDGVDLTITVADERGKAPLNQLDDAQSRALFAGAGATGERLEALVGELRDWRLGPPAAAAPASPSGDGADERPVRHGPLRTVGELGGLPDMTPEIYARVAPAVTVFMEDSGPFDPRWASPLARAAMKGDLTATPGQIDGLDAVDRQRPDQDLGPDDRLIGRTLTVGVVASDGHGGRAHRAAIVELTGDKARPYWIRFVE